MVTGARRALSVKFPAHLVPFVWPQIISSDLSVHGHSVEPLKAIKEFAREPARKLLFIVSQFFCYLQLCSKM